MLLCLLPFEVLAGLAYEQELIHQAKQDISWTTSGSTSSVSDVLDASPVEAETLHSESSLDLGESFDVVCKIFKMAKQQANAPPLQVVPALASLVLAVPKPPAI